MDLNETLDGHVFHHAFPKPHLKKIPFVAQVDELLCLFVLC